MRRRRAWRLDVVAGLLLVLGVLVAVALGTADPLDAPGATAPPRPVGNLLGRPGALFAHEITSAFGLASWALLAAWLSAGPLLAFREQWRPWARRLLGWLI